MSNKNSQVQKIALAQFKQETADILAQLEKYHHSTQNQIINIFARLLDNLPNDILSLPISECEEQYLKMYVKTSKVLSTSLIHTGMIIDDEETSNKENTEEVTKQAKKSAKNIDYEKIESVVANDQDSTLEDSENNETNLMEFETHLRDNDKDLTSTVKKIITTKSLFSNQFNTNEVYKIDESIAIEDNTKRSSSKAVNLSVVPSVAKQTNTEKALDELIIQFKYKNGKKDSIQLSKLNELKFTELDEKHAFYMEKIFDLLRK